MKTNFEMVKEFHTLFGHKDPDEIVIPDSSVQNLRMQLILEEFRELCVEFGYRLDATFTPVSPNNNLDIANIAKELADILYVVYGAAANFGIPMDEVFAEVHRSNLSKLGEDGKPIHREDGKILKGPNYSQANIEKVLHG